jgi:ssDNA-binding Zn-finger/Zn-ribbon topoisomerase 1
MSIEIVCPQCGSDDDLRGRPLGDGLIELTCDACELTWTRDPRPRCPTCGSHDVEAAPKLIVERSRGTQMSIQGVHREFLCRTCDADRIAAARDGYLPDRLPGSQ